MRQSSARFHGIISMLSVGLLASPSVSQVVEEIKLLPDHGTANDRFGEAVAIDSGKVVIGAPWNDTIAVEGGMAYVFDAATGTQLLELHAERTRERDTLGFSVAIHDDIIAVGAMNYDTNYAQSGSAYIFDSSTGEQLFQLLPSDPVPGAQFGNSIATNGEYVLVGSHFDGTQGHLPGYVYQFDASTGKEVRKFAQKNSTTEDRYGKSIAVHGDILVVGSPLDDDNGHASGSAYVYNLSSGSLIAKLLADDGARQDRFGWSVSIHNETIAVGAYLDDDNGTNSGSVYLFDVKTGNQISKIHPNTPAANSWFGWSIDLNDDVLVATSTSGRDYIFDIESGSQIGELQPSDHSMGDSFGWSVAIDENLIVSSSLRDDDNGEDSGSAYVFDLNCRADLNNDGSVSFLDISLFLTLFREQDALSDWNGDGAFNFLDISLFISTLLPGC